MNFLHYDLGQRKTGETVKVTLSGNAANVQLLDSNNLRHYKTRHHYKYYGGYVRRSPFRIAIPQSGHWHVAIDFGGYNGKAKTSVKVLPAPQLLPIAQESPLSSVPSLVRNLPDNLNDNETRSSKHSDVFISYATEEKDTVVPPLVRALKAGGLDVWYDRFTLGIGDSLLRSIDSGLANSRFGVIVLSPAFFTKQWPNYELDGLITRATTGEQQLLPIWHNLTRQEVIDYSPSLADKVARNTASHTIDEIALEIFDVVTGKSA